MNAMVRAGDIANSLEEIQRVGRMLAMTGYFAAKGDTPQAIAQIATQILAGREMGYGPFASVQGIHIIQGKPTLSANLMASAVKNSPRYDYRVREISDQICRIEFFEYVDGKRESLGISEFTLEQAQKAGVKNLDKYARNMLFARAMSNGVRWFCPDVFAGNAVYVPEELGADEDADGNMIEVTPRVVSSSDASQDVVFESPHPTAGQSNGEAPQPSKASQKTLKRLHALGTELYKDRWDEIRHRNVKRVTEGRAESSAELTEEQARKLIDGLKKLKAQQAQEAQREESLEDAESLAF